MLKQSNSQRHTHLYDKVRRDLFEDQQNRNEKKVKIPSITTICLLQIQAYVVQILANLPPKVNMSTSPSSSSSIYNLVQQKKMHTIISLRMTIRQCLRWVLLIILLLLDNVARLLNIEHEMLDMMPEDNSSSRHDTSTTALAKRSDYDQILDDEDQVFHGSSTDTNSYRDDYYHQQKKQYHYDLGANNNNNNADGISELASPIQTVKRNNHGLVSPSSPVNSPTPSFVVRQRKTSSNAASTAPPSPNMGMSDESPVLGPSRTNRTGHVRSLSNNMVDHQKKSNSTQKLRRITAQREITVQNAVLPILPKTPVSKHHHHHHRHHAHKKAPITSSVASASSSESSTAIKETTNSSRHEFAHRPQMQKTMSLSTAQQYQQQQPR